MNSPTRQPTPDGAPPPIVLCPNCDGYGWREADADGPAHDCAWCGAVGYVWRAADGRVAALSPAQLDAHAGTLETLEADRLRALGYSGSAKPPWAQAVRRGGEVPPHPPYPPSPR